MRVIVSGASGFIGRELTSTLEGQGHHVTRLVRRLPKPGTDEVGWDPKEGTADAARLEGHDAVVHLAGAGLGDHRWTKSYKAEILDSRVRGTSLLARTVAGLDQPPTVFASASAVGWYGDRGDEELTEESGPGTGFLAGVCQEWEAATAPAVEAGLRVVNFRSGIVQSPKGGSLKRLQLPFKLGVGGRFGDGKQWLSWVSLEDEIGGLLHILQNDEVRGPVNLTAPNPVTAGDYAKSLGRALHRPALLPTPTLGLDVLLGREMVREMITAGQRVLPAKLRASGYQHRHPDLDSALADALQPSAA